MKQFQVSTAVAALTVNGQTSSTFLKQNVVKWKGNPAWLYPQIDTKQPWVATPPAIGLKLTPGLTLNGEIGWHTHGSGANVDVDIDLVLFLAANEKINTNYLTMIFWAIQTDQPGNPHEIGAFEFQRGDLTEPKVWKLTQALCGNYINGDTLYNWNGETFDSIVTPKSGSYRKEGPVDDTVYWTNNFA